MCFFIDSDLERKCYLTGMLNGCFLFLNRLSLKASLFEVLLSFGKSLCEAVTSQKSLVCRHAWRPEPTCVTLFQFP